MMANIHVVTDSGARFSNPRLMRHFPLTILPNVIEIEGRRYQEDLDISATKAFALMASEGQPPRVHSPSAGHYADLYTRLLHHCDGIISIHPSRELSPSWRRARRAAEQVDKKNQIAVIDSQSFCAGQGILIRVAARMAQEYESVVEVAQAVREAVNRVYSVYCVKDVRFLEAHGYISPSHAFFCRRFGIKPLVTLEKGKLLIIEKALNQGAVIDRIVEYLAEFTSLEDAIVLQHEKQISDETRLLQERLAEEFPGQHFPFAMYSATMASYLGPATMGIAILDKEETDEFRYDF